MTAICGWVPTAGGPDPSHIVSTMISALGVHDDQSRAMWTAPGPCAVGLLDPRPNPPRPAAYAPAISGDGRRYLWMAGEIFAANTGEQRLDIVDAQTSRTIAYRRSLLDFIVERGVSAVPDFDGAYLCVLWDAWERRLALITDRFSSIPLFVAASADGVAFSSGIRGALVAPGISSDPDLEALREAMTFGGSRLGDRTNVVGVKRGPAAALVDIRSGRIEVRRYRRWPLEPSSSDQPGPEAAGGHAHGLWRTAIRRRLVGCAHPGQTLSGGLDSRAILAEGAPQSPTWTAITYGLPGCDDARYAERAAAVSGATWVFHPLYSGRDPDWLERRSAFVQETDGLMQLVDLMHLESAALQRALLDLHVSGYLGDAVCGPTFSRVCDAAGVAAKMPFNGSPLGWSWERAQGWAEDAIAALGGAAARFAIFEHKLLHSIHPIFQAMTPYLRVRRPFLDRALFDFFTGLAPDLRAATYHRMLRTSYPQQFGTIPDQSTGMPILTPRWRVNIERGRRGARRVVQRRAARLGLQMAPRQRAYHDDERVWAHSSTRGRIEAIVLRKGSLCCD